MLTIFANLYLNFPRQRRRYENMGLSMQDVLFLANDVNENMGLSMQDLFLANDVNVATFFDSVVDECGDVKLAANWIMGDIAAYLKNERLAINEIMLTPKELAELIASIQNGTISGKIGKEILVELIPKGGTVKSIIEDKDFVQIADPAAIAALGGKVIAGNPKHLGTKAFSLAK